MLCIAPRFAIVGNERLRRPAVTSMVTIAPMIPLGACATPQCARRLTHDRQKRRLQQSDAALRHRAA